ncbi:SET domain-containing protein [Streptomyces armeniacus]|uniref:SET domain-containing protein n=1 Tax=Streptomyces armeniacus TaxID=83291 RepID=A0A345XR42_9ACTN|nr:SET domain-containing protein-lysine N-methyltransferase [Streptomyces armeniacus]AXK34108.1 SET domain-containing protein [Streptomyces armeniacus]
MAPTPDPHCRLHSHAEVRPSPIAGLGLFARAPIAAGTVVARLGGRLVSEQELQDLFTAAALQPDRPYIDTIAVTETEHLVLPPRSEQFIGYSNHDCDPNLWWEGPYDLVARRDIPTDEELTSDYATSTWDPQFVLACSCGSPADCRGTVTGNDWQLPELRTRYGNHWVPVLLSRMP